MELVENGISIDQPILELYIAKNLCVSYNSYFIQFTEESLRKVFWRMANGDPQAKNVLFDL